MSRPYKPKRPQRGGDSRSSGRTTAIPSSGKYGLPKPGATRSVARAIIETSEAVFGKPRKYR
jgi:hypothetical protein